MLKRLHLYLLFLLASSSFTLAEKSVVDKGETLRRPHNRQIVRVPDIPGYVTLKCDFHIHTVFSDGIVWPTVRVREAWEEGLDAIAITDHIENQPSKRFVGGDHNSSYDIALPEARARNIVLIRAGEITREMPPGHLNALFLSDVNKLDVEDPEAAVDAALEQGGFVFWNHPGWEAQQPDDTLMFPVHKRWMEEGKIHGMEVFNEKEWYPLALKWTLENDLAVMGNSDIHDVNEHYYDVRYSHRPMTLVFAENRSEEAIKEALFDGRTAAWWGNEVAGKPEILEELFRQSVEIGQPYMVDEDGRSYLEIKNKSDLTFILEPEEGGQFPERTVLLPDGIQMIRVNLAEVPPETLFLVTNFHTGMDENLTVKVSFSK